MNLKVEITGLDLIAGAINNLAVAVTGAGSAVAVAKTVEAVATALPAAKVLKPAVAPAATTVAPAAATVAPAVSTRRDEVKAELTALLVPWDNKQKTATLENMLKRAKTPPAAVAPAAVAPAAVAPAAVAPAAVAPAAVVPAAVAPAAVAAGYVLTAADPLAEDVTSDYALAMLTKFVAVSGKVMAIQLVADLGGTKFSELTQPGLNSLVATIQAAGVQ